MPLPSPTQFSQPASDPLPEARPIITFWQQRWVQNTLPFTTSLIIHVTALLIGLAAIQTIPRVVEVVREQIIIPDAQLIDNASSGGIPNPGLDVDPNRSAAQDTFDDITNATGLGASQTLALNRALMNGGDTESAVNLLAIGPRSGGPGSGNRTGDGDIGGGIAPFGIPGGDQVGPPAPFITPGGNAHRVVYIIDASGTMMSSFPAVKAQLRKSLDVLHPTQAFNVILFRDAAVHAFHPARLQPATPAIKQQAVKWIDESHAAGGTNPLPAIRLAFQMKPELLYVLSDGFDAIDDLDSVAQEFRQLNTDGRVKVNTILLGGKSSPQLIDVMRRIANDSGGHFTIIEAGDL